MLLGIVRFITIACFINSVKSVYSPTTNAPFANSTRDVPYTNTTRKVSNNTSVSMNVSTNPAKGNSTMPQTSPKPTTTTTYTIQSSNLYSSSTAKVTELITSKPFNETRESVSTTSNSSDLNYFQRVAIAIGVSLGSALLISIFINIYLFHRVSALKSELYKRPYLSLETRTKGTASPYETPLPIISTNRPTIIQPDNDFYETVDH